MYYVIVILYGSIAGIYGSKPTEPEGKVVYVAINP